MGQSRKVSLRFGILKQPGLKVLAVVALAFCIVHSLRDECNALWQYLLRSLLSPTATLLRAFAKSSVMVFSRAWGEVGGNFWQMGNEIWPTLAFERFLPKKKLIAKRGEKCQKGDHWLYWGYSGGSSGCDHWSNGCCRVLRLLSYYVDISCFLWIDCGSGCNFTHSCLWKGASQRCQGKESMSNGSLYWVFLREDHSDNVIW